MDHSVVDLETIEALYENVCIIEYLFLHDYKCNRTITNPTFFYISSSAGAARGAGENQETLWDIGGGGREAAGQTRTVSISRADRMFRDCTSDLLQVCLCVWNEMKRQAPSLYTVFSLCP